MRSLVPAVFSAGTAVVSGVHEDKDRYCQGAQTLPCSSPDEWESSGCLQEAAQKNMSRKFLEICNSESS